MKMHRIKSEKHESLDELREEYRRKMIVIEEISREKELRQQQQAMVKEMKNKKHVKAVKEEADQFKQVREVLKKKQIEQKAKQDL